MKHCTEKHAQHCSCGVPSDLICYQYLAYSRANMARGAYAAGHFGEAAQQQQWSAEFAAAARVTRDLYGA